MLTDTGFFVLRTPLLSWHEFEQWNSGLSAAKAFADGGDLEAVAASDALRLEARLRDLLAREEIRAALYTASPHLYARTCVWLKGEKLPDEHRLIPKLVAYLVRMIGRATPFGLFAGTSTGAVSTSTNLMLSPAHDYVRHTRGDFGYLYQFAAVLEKHPDLEQDIPLRPTSCSYEVGGRLRYYEARLKDGSLTFHLVDAVLTPELEAALRHAYESGTTSVRATAETLTRSFGDVSWTSALEYARELRRSGLLKGNLIPAVTTEADPLREFSSALGSLPNGEPRVSDLNDVMMTIKKLDEEGIRCPPEAWERLEERIRGWLPAVDPPSVFRVDLHKPGPTLSLHASVVREVAAGVEVLARLAPPTVNPLARFIREFTARYDDREMPLLAVLDPESGIALDDSFRVNNSLLEGWPQTSIPERSAEWRKRDAYLLDKLIETLRSQAGEIVLTEADLEALSARKEWTPPPGVTVLATLSAKSAEDSDTGRYRLHMRRCLGPSSASLLARFCHGDPDLLEKVRAALQREDACSPDVLHAEIVHLPHPHAGNVVARPILRPYEIPVLARSGAPIDRQIPPSDLLVSIQNQRVVLRSERLQRQIIPHLTCAQVVRDTDMKVSRFLAHVGVQDWPSDLRFSWGNLDSAPFLPRVAYGRFVLAPAQWNIPGYLLRGMKSLSRGSRFAALNHLREQRGLPRIVWLEQGDNTLLVDFDNVLSLESFLAAAGRSSVRLTEVIPSPGESPVHDGVGRFHHELVVPLVRSERTHPRPVPAPTTTRAHSEWRGHVDLSHWLYLKLYCGPVAQDRVLQQLVRPFVRQLRAEDSIDRWFFVRYEAGGSHLRLRIRARSPALRSKTAGDLFAIVLNARDLIQSVAIDEYRPEEWRYGGAEGLEISERIFEVDSDAAVAAVEDPSGGGDPDRRWRLTMLGMAALLSDLDFSVQQKRRVVQSCRNVQLAQLTAHEGLRRAVGRTCRTLRSQVSELLTAFEDESLEAPILSERSRVVRQLAVLLRDLELSKRLQAPVTTLAQSHLHMWANRMLTLQANSQELVLYELLFRYYDERVRRHEGGARDD